MEKDDVKEEAVVGKALTSKSSSEEIVRKEFSSKTEERALRAVGGVTLNVVLEGKVLWKAACS